MQTTPILRLRRPLVLASNQRRAKLLKIAGRYAAQQHKTRSDKTFFGQSESQINVLANNFDSTDENNGGGL